MSAGRREERADRIRSDLFFDGDGAIDVECFVDVEVFDIEFALLAVALDDYSVGTGRAGAKRGSGFGRVY